MNENVSSILKGVVGLVSELDKLPGVSTQPPTKSRDEKTLDEINRLFGYYRNDRERLGEAVAADRFITDLARELGRLDELSQGG